MRVRSLLAVAALLATTAVTANAQGFGPVTFSEAEFPYGTTVNGLTVSTLGGQPIPTMTFGFTVGGSPSADCTIDGGPGVTTFVSTPNIEGAPGTLSIALGAAYTEFHFGFAVASGGSGGGRGAAGAWSTGSSARAKGVSALALPSAVTLTGYTSGGGVAGSVVVDALDQAGDIFAGNRAALVTAVPFTRVEIAWDPSVGRFALDNLSFGQGLSGVPTLSGAGLAALVAGIVAAGFAALRTRS
jgi:hypothetical protein